MIESQAMTFQRKQFAKLGKKQQHGLKMQEQRHHMPISQQTPRRNMYSEVNTNIFCRCFPLSQCFQELSLKHYREICFVLDHYFEPTKGRRDVIETDSIASIVNTAFALLGGNTWQFTPSMLLELWHRIRERFLSSRISILSAENTYRQAKLVKTRNARFMDDAGVIRKNPKQAWALTHIRFDLTHMASLHIPIEIPDLLPKVNTMIGLFSDPYK
jgi:hypothetical protein